MRIKKKKKKDKKEKVRDKDREGYPKEHNVGEKFKAKKEIVYTKRSATSSKTSLSMGSLS